MNDPGCFARWSHQAHEREFDVYAECGPKVEQARTWLRTDTTDYWRHQRMYRYVDPFLSGFPGTTWFTVGDGRYGRDAHYLRCRGAKVLATNISDVLLKEGQSAGLIEDYRKENAESLSFADDSFDFAFCKESLHHMPRPMLAIYEMLRVARLGVIMIEPNDEPVLPGAVYAAKRVMKRLLMAVGLSRLLRSRDTSLVCYPGHAYEDVGNYAYAFSAREVEKIAVGLDLPAVAFAGLNDWYIQGVEHETAVLSAPLFRQVRARIAAMDRCCRLGLSMAAPGMLVACILKTSPSGTLRSALAVAGFRVVDLPRNPHVALPRAPSGASNP